MSTSEMQEHLRQFVQNSIEQKMRLNNVVQDYKKQKDKSASRIETQKEVISKALSEGIPEEKIDYMNKRASNDETILKKVTAYLGEAEISLEELAMAMRAHLEQLTELDVTEDGVMIHPIGTDQGAQLEKPSMTVRMMYEGHMEVPIGTTLSQWKDSTKLVIKKIKKGDE